MSNLLDQVPSLNLLLDFDGLIKHTSIYKLQGRLEYLLNATTRELADFKVNARNPDLVQEAILKYIEEAKYYSGGNLEEIKPSILRIFGYRSFNLKTELDLDKVEIRQLLIWSPDCTWSYNELWEKFKATLQTAPEAFLSGLDVRQYAFGLLYQESLKSLMKSLKSPSDNNTPDSNLEDQGTDKIMSRQETAKYMNVSVNTVDNWVKQDLLVRMKKTHGAVRFRLSDVEKCMESMIDRKGKRNSKY